MSRNQNSRFAINPTNIDISRSTFERSSSLKTSFNVGDLIPIFVDEVLPGDTFNLDTAKVVRMQSLITPIMDNLYLDTYYFFVPNRLVWQHWRELMGENTQSAWIPTNNYSVPQLRAPSGGWNVGTIADYFGIPTGVANFTVNALPFRAYALICSEWFRSEVVSDPLQIPVNDSTVTGNNGTNYITDCAKGGYPFKAAKFMDYFSSALPSPQKGPDVTIPLGSLAPVIGTHADAMHLQGLTSSNAYSRLLFNMQNVSDVAQSGTSFYIRDLVLGDDGDPVTPPGTGEPTEAYNVRQGGSTTASITGHPAYGLPINLPENPALTTVFADLSSATSASINSLRLAFQIQKLYEKDARGGTRYIELLKAHFGVTSPDSRLQRPEYLGGNRIPININQVVQMSETASTPQGTTAAYSLTTDSHSDFTKSFVEHGFLIGLAVVRYDHTYQQGLQKFWSRKTRFDYYWPALANIGEQPILNKEIYLQGSSAVDADGSPYDEQVFGYNEAWADYRYKPSIVTGEMRSAYQATLDSWHLADYYSQMPMLSDSWIREDSSNVDRVLAVSSSVSNQLFGDFYFKLKCTRAMPMYSIPGLIDHH